MGDNLAPLPVHDRALLLHGTKRNQVLSLEEVERYGRDSFGQPDQVSIYGMPPRAWYRRGIRLLGRTAVECTRDALADLIGRDLAAAVKRLAPVPGVLVVDPFAGSCNTLYPQVFDLTRRNLGILRKPIELLQGEYRSLLASRGLPDDRGLLFFVAPPWGTALDERTGLDLRRTTPPVTEVIAGLARSLPTCRILFAVQLCEKVDPDALAEVRALLDWADLRVYPLDVAGRNHGILLGSRGWTGP